MDEIEKFNKWLNGAMRGERHIYFIGANVPDDKSEWAQAIRKLFGVVIKAHAKGLVIPVQRRVPYTSSFEYTVVRTSYPSPRKSPHDEEVAA